MNGKLSSTFVADIFMARRIEKHFLVKFKNQISFYRRFTDDAFLLWMGSKLKFKEFCVFINSIHERIKFTFEKESSQNTINYLNLAIVRVPNVGFVSGIFRKPMSLCKPIHFSSLHHPAQKWGSLTSAVLRARKLTNDPNKLWTEIKFIQKSFIDQGYPTYRTNQGIFKALNKTLWKSDQTNQSNPNPEDLKILHIGTPFIPFVSQKNTKVWNSTLQANNIKVRIQCGYQPDTNLKSLFSSYNHYQKMDQTTTLNRSGVIYGVKCVACDGGNKIGYIGETSRVLRDRINSHFGDRGNPSALRAHLENNPKHDRFQYTILGHEHRANQRKIWEALLIKKHRPKWNGDSGTKLYCSKF